MNPGMAGYNGQGYGGPEAPPKINYGWVSEAWNLFSAKAGVWIGASAMLLVPVVIGYVLFLISGFSLMATLGSSSHASAAASVGLAFLGFLGLVAMGGGGFFLSCGLHGMATRQVKGEQIEFSDVFRGGPFFWRALGLGLLVGIGVYIGTLFLIIPGLILAGLTLPALSMVTDGEAVFPAIQRSIDAMKNDLLNSVLLYLLLSLIMYAGSLALGIGIFVTMPIYWLVSALTYRDMVGIPGVPRGGWRIAPPPPVAWPPPNANPPPANIWPPAPSQTPPQMDAQEGTER
jgi:hypothetical protein